MIEIIRISERAIETIDPWLLLSSSAPRDEHDHILSPRLLVIFSDPMELVRPSQMSRSGERSCRRALQGVYGRRINTQQPRRRFSRESIRFAA